MSDLDAMRVFLFAGEALAGSCLLMALAWLAGGAKRASLRHLAWVAAFGAMLALPVLATVTPGVVVLWLAAAPAPLAPLEMAASLAPPPSAPVEAAPSWHIDLGTVALALIAVWIAGVVLIAMRHLIAALLLRALRRRSSEHPFDASELPAAAARLTCDLRLAQDERGPATWGVARPVILLPATAALWPYDRLQAVLRHEFAHVQRRDGLCQMLASLACALYWPNPLVWLGARALKREAEIAADDAVIASGMAPSDYAGELLGMAAKFRGRGFAGALSMAAPSALPARVQAILAPTPHRSGVSSMDVVKMAAIAVLTTGALVAARPSLAQDAPPPVAMATPPMPSSPPAATPAESATPAAPATPADPAAEPAPPAAAPPPPGIVESPGRIVRIVRMHGVRNPRDAERIHADIERADREVRDAMARVAPEMARVRAEVRAHDAEIRRIAAMRPQIDAEVRAALADARKQLAQIDDKAIRAKVDAALARVQARLDHAGTIETHVEDPADISDDDSDSDTP